MFFSTEIIHRKTASRNVSRVASFLRFMLAFFLSKLKNNKSTNECFHLADFVFAKYLRTVCPFETATRDYFRKCQKREKNISHGGCLTSRRKYRYFDISS